MSKVQEWQSLLLTAIGTGLGGLVSGGAIWKFLEHRQSLRKADREAVNAEKKIQAEADKQEDDDKDRLIGRYETAATRDAARITFLEGQVERQREREVALIQTNAEYQTEIHLLRKQIESLEKRLSS